jgi:hypothetical protein
MLRDGRVLPSGGSPSTPLPMQSGMLLSALVSTGAVLRPVDVGGNVLSPAAALEGVASTFKLLLCGPLPRAAVLAAAAWPPTLSTPIGSMAAAGQVR